MPSDKQQRDGAWGQRDGGSVASTSVRLRGLNPTAADTSGSFKSYILGARSPTSPAVLEDRSPRKHTWHRVGGVGATEGAGNTGLWLPHLGAQNKRR